MNNLYVIKVELIFTDFFVVFNNNVSIIVPIDQLKFLHDLSMDELDNLQIADDGQTIYVNKGIFTKSINIISFLKEMFNNA